MSTVQNASAEGLSSLQAATLLREYGANAIAEARPRRLPMLLGKFWGLIPWLLELALIIDLILGRWVEAGVIGALLVFNAVLSFLHEGRAQRALALLRQRLTVNARVRRDGRWKLLAADGIVPGDLVRLSAGDIVPADIRLANGVISVDRSVLTGESLPPRATTVGLRPKGLSTTGATTLEWGYSGPQVQYRPK